MKRHPRVRVSRRVALTAAVALVSVGLVASLSVASAARLEVRVAGPLQVMVYDVEPPEIEVPEEHTITVVARRFDSGRNEEVGGSPTRETFEIPHGQSYSLSWTGGSVIVCASVDHTVPPEHVEGLDEKSYQATTDTTHELCAQTGNGKINITSPAEAP